MTSRESIQRLTEEMLARDEELCAEIAELRRKRYAALRRVVRALPDVPLSLRHYLAEPDTAAGRPT